MDRKLLLLGLLIWAAGAVAIRLAGEHILQPGRIWELYLLSVVAVAFLVRRICGWMRLERPAWPRASLLLMLPALTLDSFTCAFFTLVFPNLDQAAAGMFGGWMLICCAAAAAAVWVEA
ncbi:MAG: DUF5367 family protein [Bryobacteraceae bacterium]